MRKEQILIWEKGEYQYEGACGFEPNIMTYLHDDDENRPAVLVIPGGGYVHVSPTEAELVALCFYEMGYQCFVLTYTVNPFSDCPLKRQPLEDISRAVRMIRKNGDTYKIKEKQLAVCGFSAGAHLCASLCVHADDVIEQNPAYKEISNRPNGAILSYPVITSGEYAHRGSFIALLGEDATEEELNYMSLEKQADANTPPCFIWQTATDSTVPVENSYLFAQALKEQGVSFEHHVFPRGEHGLSLSNKDWEVGNHWANYTLEQVYRAVEQATKENRHLSGEQAQMAEDYSLPFEEWRQRQCQMRKAVKEVAVWPQLAENWLASLFEI